MVLTMVYNTRDYWVYCWTLYTARYSMEHKVSETVLGRKKRSSFRNAVFSRIPDSELVQTPTNPAR
jgi:hypothetical protein